jgi:dethiobiotin synthetase
MSARIVLVTANDTGVGKTVLTSLLTRRLVDPGGQRVAALKPVCSGGRGDAVRLRMALRKSVALEAINPWHFKTPIAPTLAARKEGKRLRLESMIAFIRGAAAGCDLLLVEGAGGLLSPMGEDFTSLELIGQLRAIPIVVCPNRLGAVNQVALVLAALPSQVRRKAVVVLMETRRQELAAETNAKLIRKFTGTQPIEFPRVPRPDDLTGSLRNAAVRRAVDVVIRRLR